MNSKLFLAAVFALMWDNYVFAEGAAKLFQSLRPAVQVPVTAFSDGSKIVTLKEFRGRSVILNVWATWCAPCVKEMPSLDRLSAKMAGDNFVIVAVSEDNGGRSQVKPFLDKLKVKNVTILYDQGEKALRDFGIRGLPTTFLISPDGKILARLEGAAEWDTPAMVRQIKEFPAVPVH